jgi:hypothetical protein
MRSSDSTAPVRAKDAAPDQPSRGSRAESQRPRREDETRSGERQKPARPHATDAWTDSPASNAQRRGPQEARAPEKEQRGKPQHAPKGDERLGFAENVPAFMRRPSRPVKVPGRG